MADTEPIPQLKRSIARMLVVDDCDVIQKVVKRYLGESDIEVTAARDGADGLALAISANDTGKPFDVVLINMQMPVIDGCEVTRRLRQLGIQSLIVALTADPDRDKFLEAGCDDYLLKPFDEYHLTSLLERNGICLKWTD